MDDKDILVKIGKRIKGLRAASGLTQDDIAEKCNWDFQYVSRLESGKTNMTIRTLVKLSLALNIKLEEIFKDIE